MAQLQRLAVAPAQLSDGKVALTPEQQHYLSRVLRLRQGDRFIAMDGQGQSWLAALTENTLTAELLQSIAASTELPISVTLLVALPKNGMDEIVRQTTELGVGQILPIISDRTLLNPSPQKLERWQRIAQEAAEQSERLVVPKILAPLSLTAALQQHNGSQSRCYFCEARGDRPHLLNQLNLDRIQEKTRKSVDDSTGTASDVPLSIPDLAITIATGPEGGWTATEISQAATAGYQVVSLGSRILRAVTAPLVALSLVACMFEMMPGEDKNV